MKQESIDNGGNSCWQDAYQHFYIADETAFYITFKKNPRIITRIQWKIENEYNQDSGKLVESF